MKGGSFVEGLTKILVKRHIIAEREAEILKKAFRDSPKPNFDEFLLDEGLIDKENLLLSLAEYYQVPAFDSVGYFFDHQLVRMFPKEFLMSNSVIPLEQDENIMVMVASNPSDINLPLRIGRYVSYDIQFRVGLQQDIYDAIREFYDQSLTSPNYDVDLDENRFARETEIERERELEELTFEDFDRE